MQLHDARDRGNRWTAQDESDRESARRAGGQALRRREKYWSISEQGTERAESQLVLVVCESDTGEERLGEPGRSEHGERSLFVVFGEIELRCEHMREMRARKKNLKW